MSITIKDLDVDSFPITTSLISTSPTAVMSNSTKRLMENYCILCRKAAANSLSLSFIANRQESNKVSEGNTHTW